MDQSMNMVDTLIDDISRDIKRQLDEKIKEGEEIDVIIFREISENAVLAYHLFTEKKIKYLINELDEKYKELKKLNQKANCNCNKNDFFSKDIIKYIVTKMSFKDLPEY